jgi:hypothetical protein
MAVNQSQVDHIITAASEDDPEVKLQNLEREVGLIKTSIKRLLMDIRERMNELQNPFTLAASGTPANVSSIDSDTTAAKKSALDAKEAALEARESLLNTTKSKKELEAKTEPPEKKAEPASTPAPLNSHNQLNSTPPDDRRVMDEQMLSALRAQVSSPYHKTTTPPPLVANEKLRLQKVYKLFKWTAKSVKKYGHDRLEIILGSYQAMGYISKESCDEIREISRLMPANLGEEHEVDPDEFISELYALNRILVPNDTSLDRDMIEVMMEQRQQGTPPARTINPEGVEERTDLARFPMREKRISLKNKEKDKDWIDSPERI